MRAQGVFGSVFEVGELRNHRLVDSDEIKRDLHRSREYFSAASGMVSFVLISGSGSGIIPCIIPRRTVFVDNMGIGHCIMHYFEFILSTTVQQEYINEKWAIVRQKVPK